jgi:hypothetical protein
MKNMPWIQALSICSNLTSSAANIEQRDYCEKLSGKAVK